MLRIKRVFSYLHTLVPRAIKPTSRNNRSGALWSRLMVPNSRRGLPGLSALRYCSSHVDFKTDTLSSFENAPYLDKVGLAKAIEAEQDFPLRALIERYPQLKSRRFRDMYERYVEPEGAIGDAMPVEFREAMSNLEEMFIAQIRKRVLESLQTAIQKDLADVGAQLKPEEAWKEANQIRTISECSAFAYKYPDHPFTSAYRDMTIKYKLDEPGSMEALEHMKGIYSNDVLLNGALVPKWLWNRYQCYIKWLPGFAEHEDGAKHLIFEVLPLLLPHPQKYDNSPDLLALNECDLSGGDEQRGKAWTRSRRPFISWCSYGNDYPLFLGQKYHESSHLYDAEAENREYVKFQESTQIGQIIELFEEAFRNKILSDERVQHALTSYTEEEAAAEIRNTRTLFEWRIFGFEYRGTVCAEVYREFAKLYRVDDDDMVARWERLRVVAAYNGLRKPLSNRFQDLMDSYRTRLAEYRMSSEGKKELADHVITEVKEEPQSWPRKENNSSEPVVDPLGDIDDEAEVKRLLTETFPRVFVKDPITTRITLKWNPEGEPPEGRPKRSSK